MDYIPNLKTKYRERDRACADEKIQLQYCHAGTTADIKSLSMPVLDRLLPIKN